jgi:hypothetical protein
MEEQFMKIVLRKYPDMIYSFSISGDTLHVYNDYDEQEITDYCLSLSKCMGEPMKLFNIKVIGIYSLCSV